MFSVWTKQGKCVFPFVYRGKTYNKCTRVNHPRLWCMITQDGKWGNCEKGILQNIPLGKKMKKTITYLKKRYPVKRLKHPLKDNHIYKSLIKI
mgnify:CR=1 FL=1